jgi:hypothetical protein
VNDLTVVHDIEMISHAAGHVKVLLNQNNDAVLFDLVNGLDEGIDDNRGQTFCWFIGR